MCPFTNHRQFDRVDNDQLATLAVPHMRTMVLHRKTVDTFDPTESTHIFYGHLSMPPKGLLRVSAPAPMK